MNWWMNESIELRFEFSDAEGGQNGGQWGETVAEWKVNTWPVEEVGQAGLLSGRQAAQSYRTAALAVVRALTNQMIPLNTTINSISLVIQLFIQHYCYYQNYSFNY